MNKNHLPLSSQPLNRQSWIVLFLLMVIASGGAALAQGQLYIDFNYPPGGVNSNPGWINVHPESQSQVAEEMLTYSSGDITLDNEHTGRALRLQTEIPLDNAAQLRIPNQTDSFYISVLLRTVPEHFAVENLAMQIWFWDDHFQRASPVPSINQLRSGVLGVGIGEERQFTETSTAGGQTHLVVAHVEKAGNSATFNRITLFVDPDDLLKESGASAAVEADTGKDSLDRLGFRTIFTKDGQARAASVLGEIRIGPTWESVLMP